jgi:hypothetical protein
VPPTIARLAWLGLLPGVIVLLADPILLALRRIGVGTLPIRRRIARRKRVLGGAVDKLLSSLGTRGNTGLFRVARMRVAAFSGSILLLLRPAFLSVTAVLVLIIDHRTGVPRAGRAVNEADRSMGLQVVTV